MPNDLTLRADQFRLGVNLPASQQDSVIQAVGAPHSLVPRSATDYRYPVDLQTRPLTGIESVGSSPTLAGLHFNQAEAGNAAQFAPPACGNFEIIGDPTSNGIYSATGIARIPGPASAASAIAGGAPRGSRPDARGMRRSANGNALLNLPRTGVESK